MAHRESGFRFKLPKLPKALNPFSDWLQFVLALFGVISLVGAVAIFVASRFAPDFIAEYKDMDVVPVSAIKKHFGLMESPLGNDTETRLLRVVVRNNKTSSGAENVRIIVADYIQNLTFVMKENPSACNVPSNVLKCARGCSPLRSGV